MLIHVGSVGSCSRCSRVGSTGRRGNRSLHDKRLLELRRIPPVIAGDSVPGVAVILRQQGGVEFLLELLGRCTRAYRPLVPDLVYFTHCKLGFSAAVHTTVYIKPAQLLYQPLAVVLLGHADHPQPDGTWDNPYATNSPILTPSRSLNCSAARMRAIMLSLLVFGNNKMHFWS